MLSNEDEKPDTRGSTYGTHKNEKDLDDVVIESDLLGLEDHKEKLKNFKLVLGSEAANEE